jgi:hypothetical protein
MTDPMKELSALTLPLFSSTADLSEALAFSKDKPTTAIIVSGSHGFGIAREPALLRTHQFGGKTLADIEILHALPDAPGPRWLLAPEPRPRYGTGAIDLPLVTLPGAPQSDDDEPMALLGVQLSDPHRPRVLGIYWKTEILRAVNDVWECPRNPTEVYPASGYCRIHNVKLRKR